VAVGSLAGSGSGARPPEGGAAPAAVVDLQAPATCETGARCAITALVRCPVDARCTLEPPGRLGAFEVLQVTDDGPTPHALRRWQLTLVAFEPGMQRVLPLAVRVVGARDGSVALVSSASASIDVRLPDAAPDDRLREAPGPIDPGLDWRVVAAWTLAGTGVLGGLECARRLRRRSRARPRPTAGAPTVGGVIASLRALERRPATSAEDVLAIYRRISDELRGFLRERLAVPAEALSSQELVRALASTSIGPVHAPRGRALLDRVDRVKFGGDRPDAQARREAIASAIDLVTALGLVQSRTSERRGDVA
jgi:hypothetical protein